MSETPVVLTEKLDKVLLVTLNRPEKRNPLMPELVCRLTEILDETARNEAINVVVLTGAGKTFCAGLDLRLLEAWEPAEKLEYLNCVTRLFHRVWTQPQPVICAVNGPALAGGFDLAAFCDIRLAAKEARFGQAEINIGLTQIVHPLYKSIGLARAKELALTGVPISADEAWRIGLVNHVYESAELLPNALEMAWAMAEKSRLALFETKRLTRELIDLDVKTAQEEIGKSFLKCLESEEHKEAVADLLAKISSGK